MSISDNNGLTLRLVAFAFADVANYTRLMSEDSARTVQKWAEFRRTILFHEMDAQRGRLVNEAGDSVLIEFPSARAAVSWALQVQRAAKQRPENDQDIQIRIGINVDDVLDDGGALQSDGIVIAARVQDFATPGTIMVTQIVRDIVDRHLPVKFRDRGAPSLKNVERHLRVFEVEDSAGASSDLIQPHATWSSRPTLAVLPFETLGADPDDSYFGEGITEDIITGVSRNRSMFVIARSSTLQFSQSGKSQKEIAAALGVKYLLTGVIRRQGKVLRINTELVDVDRSRTIWAERYDGTDSDIFSFQDQIASSIVATLEPKLQSAAASDLGTRPTESLDAYDCVLRALSQLYQANAISYGQARVLLKRAISLDPSYAQAHSYLAWCLNFLIAEGASGSPEQDRKLAALHSRKAVEIDPEDALCLSIRAHVLGLHENRPDEATQLLDDALRLNPNLPIAWGLSATNLAYQGNDADARTKLMNVWKLTPYDPLNFFFLTAGGLIEIVAGDYDEAVRLLQRARQSKPEFVACLRLLAPALALAGNTDAAVEVGQELLLVDPTFLIDDFMAWYPLTSPATRNRLVEGMMIAGLPHNGQTDIPNEKRA